MESVSNYRSRKFFSGKTAKVYPTTVPSDERYSVYIDAINEGCHRLPAEKISVLELGCGTGRYFSLLTNVKKLVGVDISDDMLQVAKEKIAADEGLRNVTELVKSSIEDYIPAEKFHFIYSIGTLGEYCELNKDLLEKMLSYMHTDGFLFFTLVDAESFYDKEYVWLKKRVFRLLVKLLPYRWRVKVDANTLKTADWKHLFLTTEQVEKIFASTSLPIRWELSKAKDNLHVHHICKIWFKAK